jgi:sec-independent protein translocase protein TatB
MFGVSPVEFAGLAVVAVIVFGPDRLPKLANDAGRWVRHVRQLVNAAKRDFGKGLGPEFADLNVADLNVADLNPRGFVRQTLLDAVDDPPELDNTNTPRGDQKP